MQKYTRTIKVYLILKFLTIKYKIFREVRKYDDRARQTISKWLSLC